MAFKQPAARRPLKMAAPVPQCPAAFGKPGLCLLPVAGKPLPAAQNPVESSDFGQCVPKNQRKVNGCFATSDQKRFHSEVKPDDAARSGLVQNPFLVSCNNWPTVPALVPLDGSRFNLALNPRGLEVAVLLPAELNNIVLGNLYPHCFSVYDLYLPGDWNRGGEFGTFLLTLLKNNVYALSTRSATS